VTSGLAGKKVVTLQNLGKRKVGVNLTSLAWDQTSHIRSPGHLCADLEDYRLMVVKNGSDVMISFLQGFTNAV